MLTSSGILNFRGSVPPPKKNNFFLFWRNCRIRILKVWKKSCFVSFIFFHFFNLIFLAYQKFAPPLRFQKRCNVPANLKLKWIHSNGIRKFEKFPFVYIFILFKFRKLFKVLAFFLSSVLSFKIAKLEFSFLLPFSYSNI